MLLWYLSIEVKSISASWKWPKEATCRSKYGAELGSCLQGFLNCSENVSAACIVMS